MLKKEMILQISNMAYLLADVIESINSKTIGLEPEIQNLEYIKLTLNNIETEYEHKFSSKGIKINKFIAKKVK